MGATDERARITFERSGGFAGIIVRTEVDTNELPEDEATEYRRLLDDVDLAALARPSAARAGQPDRFQYDLRIVSGDREYELSYGEKDLPAQLRPLIERLTKRATRRST